MARKLVDTFEIWLNDDDRDNPYYDIHHGRSEDSYHMMPFLHLWPGDSLLLKFGLYFTDPHTGVRYDVADVGYSFEKFACKRRHDNDERPGQA